MWKDSSNVSILAKVFLILVGSGIIIFKALPGADLFGLIFILLGICFLFIPVKENRLVRMLGWLFMIIALLCLAAFIFSQVTR